MKKISKLCLVILLVTIVSFSHTDSVHAELSEGDLVRYIPTQLVVSNGDLVIHGYFVNLNDSIAVSDFHNFKMTLFYVGDELVTGDFGTLESFTLEPYSVYPYTLTMTGAGNRITGNLIDCNSYTFTTLDFSYTWYSR